MPKGQTLRERVLAKVRRTRSHWYWTGAVRRDGIGVVWYRGRMEQARRLLWVLEHNESLDRGQQILPCCGMGLCINPGHSEVTFFPRVRNGMIYPEHITL